MFFNRRNKQLLMISCALALLASTSGVFAATTAYAAAGTTSADRLSKIDSKRPVVALTFDDGPNKIYTPQILDILAENDAKATFFMIGNLVEPNRETVLQVQQGGHEIENHSYDHPDLATLPKEEYLAQIQLTNEAIAAVTGETPKFVRPPYGSYTAEMLEASPLPFVNWSLDTLDWESRDVASIVKKLETAEDGDVILLHDIYQSTVDAVKIILPILKEKGFQFVTLSDLFAIRGIEISPHEIYRKAYQSEFRGSEQSKKTV